MKKEMFAVLAAALLAAGCATEKAAPEPDFYRDDAPIAGAAALQGKSDVKNSPYFKNFDFYAARPTKSLILLPKFHTIQQTTEYTCAPAAVKMVLDYFGRGKKVSERELAREMQVRDETCPREDGGVGATTEAVAAALQKRDIATLSGRIFETEDEFAAFLKRELSAGNPVLLCYAAWGSHWVVAIGYDNMGTKTADDDVVILADPYDIGDHRQDGYNVMPLSRLFWSWYDPCMMYGDMAIEQYVVAKRPAK